VEYQRLQGGSMSMSIEQEIMELVEMVELIKIDAEKFDDGNKAAGTRVRKALQNVKNQAQTIRIEVQSIKKGDK